MGGKNDQVYDRKSATISTSTEPTDGHWPRPFALASPENSRPRCVCPKVQPTFREFLDHESSCSEWLAVMGSRMSCLLGKQQQERIRQVSLSDQEYSTW